LCRRKLGEQEARGVTQINAVANPIINSPYREPDHYWLIREGLPPEKVAGRRPASYFFRVPDRAARGRREGAPQVVMFDEISKGQEVLLDTANLLRQRVKEWREKRQYEGATRVTRELLELWNSPDRQEPMFYAQKEAVETIIFLVEGPPDLRQGIRVPLDEPGPDARTQGFKGFVRFAVKMATGTGKTTVMGMLAAWSILNKIANAHATEYSDTVLIVCPNVTIRDRLRELDPDLDEASLYRLRELVPLHRMPELRRGDVIVTNWHVLERQEVGDVNGQSERVVKRGVPVERQRRIRIGGKEALTEADIRHAAAMGAYSIVEEIRDRHGVLGGFRVKDTRYVESERAFVNRILKNRRGHASAILVLNDEAHHAYRRGQGDPEFVMDDETAAAEAREATVWIEGLDRIHKVLGGRGIRLCVDLSATPFYLQGSGNEVGKPFPWIVSDFSLLEAIESGLVKIPQLPTQDASGAGTPAYFNVWRWVEERAAADGLSGDLSPVDVVRYAAQPIVQLAEEWRRTEENWRKQFDAGARRSNVPPVFIIVCASTALAKVLYEWLALGEGSFGQGVAEFRNCPGREVTVRIDSKVTEDLESGHGQDEARRLRFILETVGKTQWPGGRVPDEYEDLVEKNNHKALQQEAADVAVLDASVPPGRNIRCIISVYKLTEGWDATTVTHVVGLRPFGSQLLCEQVIGRALRRTSYAMDPETGFFREETAKIFGVPFELIPFKVDSTGLQPPTPPANHIFAVPEKAAYEIEFPVVEGYLDSEITRLTVDWERVSTLTLDSDDPPDSTLMRGLASHDGALAAFGPGAPELVSLDAWRSRVRIQQVAFALARELTVAWVRDRGSVGIPTHRLFPQLLEIVSRFLATKVQCRGNRVIQDVAINPFFGRALGAISDAITAVDEDGRSLERPIVAGIRSTRWVDFHTGKPISPVHKCHLNAGVFDTSLAEQQAAFVLDTTDRVTRWVKNERLGFVIPYRRDGILRRYFPDFLVVLDSADRLIIETKGRETPDVEIKSAAARRWCTAVNNDVRFGYWEYHLVWDTNDLVGVLRGELSGRRRSPRAALADDILRKAEYEVDRLRKEGWTREKFAAELENLVNEKKSEDG
jgi:type III restriction enzyme